MAYVKVIRNKDVFALVDYLFRGREIDDPVLYHNCLAGDVAGRMYATQQWWSKNELQAIHIVQSFSETDSKLLTPMDYADIGDELAKSKFPGHEFVVVTHTDSDKVHNHIVVNPVSVETGKIIPNKFRVLYDLRNESDRLSMARGLSVIESQSILRWDHHTEDVKAIKKRGGFSWVIDLKEKCDFARKFSTNFDEYASILNQFGIEVRVENKNIQYYYPGHRQKRGGTKGLGRNYTKEGLVDQFRENYKKFFEIGLKATPIESINFEDHWKFHRGVKEYILPEYRVKDLAIPLDVFKKVAEIDLIELCRKNNINISQREDGTYELSDRPYIQLLSHEWVNEKKKTSGTQLEFLSYLHKENFLKTLEGFDTSGKVTKLLESVPLNKPSFQAFHIKESVDIDEHLKQKKLAESFGFSASAIGSLLKKSKIKFFPNKVKFYWRDNNNVSLSFYKLADSWVCRKHQGLNQVFYSSLSTQKKKTLVVDPINFLSSVDLIRGAEKNTLPFNLVVPLKPLNYFLDENRDTLKRRSGVFIYQGKQRLSWGNDGNFQKMQLEIERMRNELGIGYSSIEEMLRDVLLKPLER